MEDFDWKIEQTLYLTIFGAEFGAAAAEYGPIRKSCEDNLPVSSNISKPNSAPKRCDRIGSASVATCKGWAAIRHYANQTARPL